MILLQFFMLSPVLFSVIFSDWLFSILKNFIYFQKILGIVH